jgi:hypothetical protein
MRPGAVFVKTPPRSCYLLLMVTPLTLHGPPRERGRAHGEALRLEIHALFSAWEEEVHRETGLALSPYLARLRGDTDFLPAIERFAPGLLAEVDGIAEGANVSREDCRCLQYLDEHWHHLARLQGGAACSSVGGPGCIGQNMDLPRFLDGFQTLLRIRYPGSDLELLVPSFAGLIGLYGLSSRGVALCVNTISQLRAAPTGLPVAFVVRSTLERATVDEALAHLERLPHASGQNYLVGGPAGVADLECSAGGAVRLAPTAGNLCHTNHPLLSADLDPGRIGWDADRRQADLDHGLTFTRLESLERGVGAEPPAVERVKELLGAVAHPLEAGRDVITFSSAVFEPGPRRAHVASGPAGTPYRTVTLG